MLKNLTNEKLMKLNIEAKDWEDAIRQSAQPMIDEGKVKQSYVEDMISGIKEVGPYIVLTKHVALPHARPESGAIENAIGIATLAHPVEFGNKDNDPVKYIFSLSATDNERHLCAMAEFVELLNDSKFYEMLDNAQDAEEVMRFLKG